MRHTGGDGADPTTGSDYGLWMAATARSPLPIPVHVGLTKPTARGDAREERARGRSGMIGRDRRVSPLEDPSFDWQATTSNLGGWGWRAATAPRRSTRASTGGAESTRSERFLAGAQARGELALLIRRWATSTTAVRAASARPLMRASRCRAWRSTSAARGYRQERRSHSRRVLTAPIGISGCVCECARSRCAMVES